MKRLWLYAFLVASLLHVSALGEQQDCRRATNSVAGKHGNGASCFSNVTEAATGASDPNEARGNKDDGTVVVDVWSSEDTAQKLSPGFAHIGLTAASRMQNTERRMEESIERGFPLGESWIRLDFDTIDDSLRVASLSVRNDADRQALQQLQAQVDRLRLWSDWLIEQNRELRLADYYISPAKLDNDEQFQTSVTCTNYLLSMLASGQLQEEDRSCR